ncbi:putative transcription factor & chromatin remodeling ARID family [Helianthus annuus]|uniref:Putative ARID DNA-binding domain-containing protein n=1 Tax=Helianthus annuus TaxID=4232 RepID=A0A251SSI2_HELAN|nr:putative transcription factor & chromatin remodeling ARID family [Helianthus annuus]KAJ0481560.1 putative transcription factor & chromatin remodeling ARID family [Helianthus annuus]KAJ0498004.1 putative transcription factor & chromatin remodeling ARID family [Helianthus annuus]KAJ0664005.1 putative transcription factor & chromatin remodeling ARID family [Helianthus annuus]KAJ0671491.1 putative transcription factor & chromatin remodeling ARID family [Helianthus annuus]
MSSKSGNNPLFRDKPPKSHNNEYEDQLLPPTSGIRAGYISDDDLKPSSTMMPCMHCTEEKCERKWMQRCCYYYNRPGHKISACQEKEKDEESQLLRLAVNTATQKHQNEEINQQNNQRQEYTVIGTDGGYWSDIWYVSKTFKHHFSGNIDMFKRMKNMSCVETETGENNFFFIRGIGAVDVITGSEKIRVQSVFYTPDIDRNVLSLDQLMIQGFTVKFMGDVCKLFPTFSVPVYNKRNGHTGLTKEEEIGELEKQYVVSKNSDHEKFKTEFLNEYFENLNITTNEPDWNILILQAMSFKNFQDCKALLNMLEDEDYVIKYKYYLETAFDNMIEWFINEKLEIRSRPLPAYATSNRKVILLDLYMAVKREGGHRRITENGMWAMIAKDTGFEFEDGEYMRLIYAMYLDVLVYYYKFKVTQEKAIEIKEEKTVDPKQSMSEGDKEIMTDAGQTMIAERSSSTSAVEKEMKHYALFTNQAGAAGGIQDQSEIIQDIAEDHYAFYGGGDWHGLKKLKQRKKFDFTRAKKAITEANHSVIKNSH